MNVFYAPRPVGAVGVCFMPTHHFTRTKFHLFKFKYIFIYIYIILEHEYISFLFAQAGGIRQALTFYGQVSCMVLTDVVF
jgi:hypothetical protein